MSTIIQAKSIDAHWNYQATLAYGLKTTHVTQAVAETYNFFYKVNALLIREGFDFFENLVLGNTFSGMLSELLVKNIAKHCPSLARNAYVGGHPDLIPTGKYTDDEVLRGSDGIEVKTSRQRGGGIGRKLIQATIDHYRRLEGNQLYLETNSVLKPAIRLYEQSGFVRQPGRRPGSPYERSNVYMIWADTPGIHTSAPRH